MLLYKWRQIIIKFDKITLLSINIMKNRKKLYIFLSIICLVILSLSVVYYFYISTNTDNEKIKDIYSPKEPPSNTQNAEKLDENNF